MISAEKSLLYIGLTAILATGCAGGGGTEGGGGITVGNSLTPPVETELVLTIAPKSLSDTFAPAWQPMAYNPVADTAQAITEVTRAEVGVHQLQLRVANDCQEGLSKTIQWEGPFTLSLTDGTIQPELAPIAVSSGTQICRIKMEWSGGDIDKPAEGPPSLLIEGFLWNGLPFELATKDAEELEIQAPTGNPVTNDIYELKLNLPYGAWLQAIKREDIAHETGPVVRINDDTYDDLLETIEDLFEEHSDAEEGESCDKEDSRFAAQSGEDICLDDDDAHVEDTSEDSPEHDDD